MERPVGMPFLERFASRALDATSERQPRATERVGDGLEHRGTWIACSVDAVTHAHDSPACGQLGRNPGLRVPGFADRVEHVEHRSGRAAVQRALQGADGRRDSRDQVGAGRGHHPCSECRGVHPVVDDGGQVGFESAGSLLVAGDAEHAQEVGAVGGTRVGRDEPAASVVHAPGTADDAYHRGDLGGRALRRKPRDAGPQAVHRAEGEQAPVQPLERLHSGPPQLRRLSPHDLADLREAQPRHRVDAASTDDEDAFLSPHVAQHRLARDDAFQTDVHVHDDLSFVTGPCVGTKH